MWISGEGRNVVLTTASSSLEQPSGSTQTPESIPNRRRHDIVRQYASVRCEGELCDAEPFTSVSSVPIHLAITLPHPSTDSSESRGLRLSSPVCLGTYSVRVIVLTELLVGVNVTFELHFAHSHSQVGLTGA